jgi:hypothetical protein
MILPTVGISVVSTETVPSAAEVHANSKRRSDPDRLIAFGTQIASTVPASAAGALGLLDGLLDRLVLADVDGLLDNDDDGDEDALLDAELLGDELTELDAELLGDDDGLLLGLGELLGDDDGLLLADTDGLLDSDELGLVVGELLALVDGLFDTDELALVLGELLALVEGLLEMLYDGLAIRHPFRGKRCLLLLGLRCRVLARHRIVRMFRIPDAGRLLLGRLVAHATLLERISHLLVSRRHLPPTFAKKTPTLQPEP